MYRKKLYMMFFVLLFCGCSIMGIDQIEGMKGLLFAKDEITHLAEQYELTYQGASITAQMNWQDKVDPLFLEAERILNEWEFFLNIGKDPTNIRNQYIVIRNRILQTLVEIKEG